MSIDPVGFEETGNPAMFNRFAYALNDPVNLYDPSGENPVAKWVIKKVTKKAKDLFKGKKKDRKKDRKNDDKNKKKTDQELVKKEQDLNNAEKHLTERDLDAATRELAGEVVSRKSTGTPYDHVKKVRNARRLAFKTSKRLKGLVKNPNTTRSQRRKANRLIKKADRLVNAADKALGQR